MLIKIKFSNNQDYKTRPATKYEINPSAFILEVNQHVIRNLNRTVTVKHKRSKIRDQSDNLTSCEKRVGPETADPVGARLKITSQTDV